MEMIAVYGAFLRSNRCIPVHTAVSPRLLFAQATTNLPVLSNTDSSAFCPLDKFWYARNLPQSRHLRRFRYRRMHRHLEDTFECPRPAILDSPRSTRNLSWLLVSGKPNGTVYSYLRGLETYKFMAKFVKLRYGLGLKIDTFLHVWLALASLRHSCSPTF